MAICTDEIPGVHTRELAPKRGAHVAQHRITKMRISGTKQGMGKRSAVALAGIVAMGSAAACFSGGPLGQQGASGSSPTQTDGGAVLPFQADPPDVYVAKAKNILTGLPPTQAEIDQVTANPAALSDLIDDWIAGKTNPQTAVNYQAKTLVFFELAFQQTQITITDFTQMIPQSSGLGSSTQTNLLLQNVRESFARTALAMVTSGQPFTDTLTTHSFMMTPPLMELYAFLDSQQATDAEGTNDALKKANPGVSLTFESSEGPIPLSETIDPTSPNFMHWYDPDITTKGGTGAGCNDDPRVYPLTSHGVHLLLYGSLDPFRLGTGNTIQCNGYGGTGVNSQFTTADFSAWKMVTIRQPGDGEATTKFYDVPTLRTLDTLVLSTPRAGFFSTPAFFANWQTNMSNQDRVTMNQTLIVATGMDVDGTDPTKVTSTPGLDTAHATQPACVGCHQTLDPTRSILQATYSYGYGNQDQAALVAQKGQFQFQNVIKPVSSIDDLANVLVSHPAFASAWAQKLCYYVDSQACVATDPEFQRIVSDFTSNGYNWNTLVKEIVASPITTNASESVTAAQEGELVAVSRRDHLCAALNDRLGLVDVCDLNALTPKPKTATISEIGSGLPSDGYGRGAPIPVLPNAPTLFYRAGVENMCEAISMLVVDGGANAPAGSKQYASTAPNDAIADFVSNLMALESSDSRASQAQTLLQQHFAAAEKAGASATDALRSTFVVACLSPSVTGMGM
jgi:hypothetical protein